jgi:aminocarboxymuconate-semialdehyde decarboxylase
VKIDVHAHYYPPAVLELLATAYAQPATPRERIEHGLIDNRIRKEPAMWRIEERLPEMDRVGLDVQVLSISLPQVHHPDAATSVALAQATNDGLAEVCRQYSTRFKAFASLPLPHVEASLTELRRAIDDLGLHGVAIGSNIVGQPLDEPAFEPVWAALHGRRLPLFIHPMTPCGVEAMADYEMTVAFGYPLETCLAATRLAYSGVCERNPDMAVILCHAGGFIPYQWSRIDAAYRNRPALRERLPQAPTAYLRRMYYDNVVFRDPVPAHHAALHCCIATVGIDQMVLGSDYPFGLAEIGQTVAGVEASGLSAADQEKIFSANALRILR